MLRDTTPVCRCFTVSVSASTPHKIRLYLGIITGAPAVAYIGMARQMSVIVITVRCSAQRPVRLAPPFPFSAIGISVPVNRELTFPYHCKLLILLYYILALSICKYYFCCYSIGFPKWVALLSRSISRLFLKSRIHSGSFSQISRVERMMRA